MSVTMLNNVLVLNVDILEPNYHPYTLQFPIHNIQP